MRLEIDAREVARFRDMIFSIVASGQDTLPMMEEIAELGVASTQMNFRLERAPDGTPWKQSIRAKEQGGHTLKQSGRLAASISPEANSDTAAWGTNVEDYAAIHQFGGTIRPVQAARLAFNIPGIGFRTADEVIIPARPYVGFNDELTDGIGEIIQDHFMRGVRS